MYLKNFKKLTAFFFSFLCATSTVFATPVTKSSITDLMNTPLEKLVDIPIDSGTKTKEKTLRETPNIVTIINAEMIKNLGARDLGDILQSLPSFDVALDVAGVAGLGMRGNWVHEGKVLLLIDGIEITEPLFGNNVLGGHVPVENIEKIEIIRGAGSVLYGGFAEFGVINITTRQLQDESTVALSLGKMQGGEARKSLSFNTGQHWGTAKIFVNAAVSNGLRSDGDFTDNAGQTISLANDYQLNNRFLNAGFELGNFNARFLYDDYALVHHSQFGEIEPQRFDNRFTTFATQLRYTYPISDKFKLKTKVEFSRKDAWNQRINGVTDVKTPVEKIDIQVDGNYSVTPELEIAGGVAWNKQNTTNLSSDYIADFPQYDEWVGFMEAVYQNPWGNFTAGMRYTHHNYFGNSTVPRFAWTKRIDDWHIKLLYSQAFRTPTVQNYSLNSNIRPEKTQMIETEIGYMFHPRLAATVNLFNIKTKDTIVYDVEPISQQQTYFNAKTSGTSGIEAELHWQPTWGDIVLSHSYYHKDYDENPIFSIIDYQTGEINPTLNLGFARFKTNLKTTINLNKKLTLTSSLTIHSSRYGYESVDEQGNYILKRYPTSALTNVTLRYLWDKNTELSATVHDVFANGTQLIQPYHGGHPPLPDTSRELMLQVRYKF